MRLYGKRPVLERLRVCPETIRAIYLEEGSDAANLVEAAKAARRSVTPVRKNQFFKLAGDLNTQGVVAEVDPFRYADLEDFLTPSERRPILLMLDRLTDPQNLGAIMRTMACLGQVALVLPKHDSVEVTEAVLRVACGGENHVKVARVVNLTNAVEAAKQAGFWILGTVPSGGTPIHQVDWPWPLALVLGSEGCGIRPGLAKQVELSVTVPMPGAALSYNAATAAALIAYEITRSRLINRAASRSGPISKGTGA